MVGGSSALSLKGRMPFFEALACVVRLAAIAVPRKSRVRLPLMAECTYKDCFVPPERHDECAAAPISPCWLPDGARNRVHHQHVPKRSQGGKRAVVMLCAGHHDNIDNGTRYEGLRLSNRISHWDGDSGPRDYYEIVDRDTGEVLVKLEVKE